MKPFSLEPVLRYRQQLEDTARQNLFASLEEEKKIRDTLDTFRTQLAELYHNLAVEREEGTTGDRLQIFEQRTNILQKDIAAEEDNLNKQQEVVARKRRLLIQASQDKKALEKLKEKQNSAYNTYLNKKESAMLDEIAVLRHGH